MIAYFSRGGLNYVEGSIVDLSIGNTGIVAMILAQETGGDLFKIDPSTPYPKDYHACTALAQSEKRENARPAILGVLPVIANYDTVLLGYPNYWGTMPMPVWTFLEALDFTGKTILPLCTHEGSGMGTSETDLKKICPTAKVVKGLSVYGSKANSANRIIREWLRQNEII